MAPKTYLPNYRGVTTSCASSRRATSARARLIDLCGQTDVPFGTRLLFQAEDQPLLSLLRGDLRGPVDADPAVLAGGARPAPRCSSTCRRPTLPWARTSTAASSCPTNPARCIAAYLYCAAGYGESTTDLAWDGHGMIYENGSRVAETERFAYASHLVYRRRRSRPRSRRTACAPTASASRPRATRMWCHPSAASRFSAAAAAAMRTLPLERSYERFPYVPDDPATRDERCHEVYEIQVQGLAKRLAGDEAPTRS